MSETSMRRFWDARAQDDPLHYIDSRQPYGQGDHARFWAGGEDDLAALLATSEVTIETTDTVVEIGCGIGRLTRPLARMSARVVALDVSERMLALARAEHPDLGNVEWLLGDGSSLTGIPDASADVCISWVVFQHIPDPRVTLAYVREMGRVLKPGGLAAFQVSTNARVHRRRGRLSVSLGRWRGLTGPGESEPEWLGSSVTVEDVRRAARAGDMQVEHIAHEGTQYCVVRARRGGGGSPAEQPPPS